MAWFENLFPPLCGNPRPVILDVDGVLIDASDTNSHVRAAVFDSVSEQILEYVS
ncbi:hypothetical protein SAMN05216218_1092 [Halorientalis regularis]|uniref:Uncharacterized protein n=1 Tax=Halorientalis regularis TaxID=660518 RepID=A0A1G7NH04_9EURY|nr:hypothetical protein SAMN05216218_1092 [Halorientalis regularis]